MEKLTERQEKVLSFLREYFQRHGYPPTFREIGERFGFLWTAAKGHLRALERKGYVRLNPSRSRGIEIVGMTEPEGVMIPIAGRIRAGRPIPALEERDAQICIDRGLFPSEGSFSLRVTGDSMKEAGILDGDYVIIRPQESIGDGEIGVVLIGDEATVKRVLYKDGEITLKPENSRMEPVTYAASEVRIIGKVIGVIRKMS